MHAFDHPVRRGLTMIEVLIIVVLVVVGVFMALPFMARRSGCSDLLTCSTRVNQIHKGLILFANDFGGSYPVPMDISPATAAITAQTGNSSASLFSYMVFNTYYSPEVITCPQDASPNLVVKTDYRYGTYDDPNWNNAWLWDPNFSADITRPGANASYATLAMLGERKKTQWRDSLDPNFAVAGDRGPKDGAWDANSLTLRRHGQHTDWTGNIAFNDGHVSSMTIAKKDAAPFQFNGDNLFFADDGEMGGDMWLGLFGDTTEETTTPFWD